MEVCCRELQCADFLTSESEEEQVRGAKMQPLAVVDRIGQRLVSAANLLLEISAGAPKRLRLFPEQTEGGQEAAVRKGCERGSFSRDWESR